MSSKGSAHEAIVERSIATGVKRAREAGAEALVTVKLTPAQSGRLEELCQVLGLSARSLLNMAVKYGLFEASDREALSRWQRQQRETRGAQGIQFAPTAETSFKLEASGGSDQIAAYAVAGVELLYERLIARQASAS
jgi:hypothetical protein